MENNFKYYVEIGFKDCKHVEDQYIIQSVWFDTEKEALKWAKNIAYKVDELQVSLMRAPWDLESDTYFDIDFVRNIKV